VNSATLFSASHRSGGQTAGIQQLYQAKDYEDKLKPYESVFKAQLELYSSHHPDIAFDFITNEIKDKFKTNLEDIKVDKANHKLVVSLQGATLVSNWAIKMKIQCT
jgi:hypothetical protein